MTLRWKIAAGFLGALLVLCLTVPLLLKPKTAVRGLLSATAEVPYTAADFQQVSFRAVKNLRTGTISRTFCGTDGLGLFFNTGDSAGGSCIASDPFHATFTVVGSKLYVLINTPDAFRETGCYSAAYHAGCTDAGIADCGKMLVSDLDQVSVGYQVLDVDTMEYLGQSATAGGTVKPIDIKVAVCPTPAPSPSLTPTNSPAITATPVPTSAVPATRTPTAPPAGSPSPSPTPGCEGSQFGLPCPTPSVPPVPTISVSPPADCFPSACTPTPNPTAAATAVPTMLPTEPAWEITLTPTPSPSPTPTTTAVASPTPTPRVVPPSPTPTPKPPKGGGCASFGLFSIVLIGGPLAEWRRRLRRAAAAHGLRP